mgnify:CR=1 FL=1
MEKFKLALATDKAHPQLTKDDQILVDALHKAGIHPTAAVWDSDLNWSNFDAVLIRSTWDYYLSAKKYLDWTAKLDHLKIPLWNDSKIVRWNHDKAYLLELREQGFAVVPTVKVIFESPNQILQMMAECDWKKAVVKPTISGGSWKTFVISSNSFPELSYDSGYELLIQPFLNSIQTEGEISLIFFDKKLSHAVHKKPAPGEFRVQSEFGGKDSPIDAPAEALKLAQKILDSVPHDLLYARVDLVFHANAWLLMELELIEPHLFLASNRNAANNLARAIQNRFVTSSVTKKFHQYQIETL